MNLKLSTMWKYRKCRAHVWLVLVKTVNTSWLFCFIATGDYIILPAMFIVDYNYFLFAEMT